MPLAHRWGQLLSFIVSDPRGLGSNLSLIMLSYVVGSNRPRDENGSIEIRAV